MFLKSFVVLLLSVLFLSQQLAAGHSSDALLENTPGFKKHASERGDHKDVKDGVEEALGVGYEPEFPTMSRSIIGRVESDDEPIILQNNVIASNNTITIEPSNILYFTFPSSALHASPSNETPVIPGSLNKRSLSEAGHGELRKRDDDVDFHLTLSVCTQPFGGTEPLPPLKLFVSWTNPKPGSGSGPEPEAVPPVEDGLASYSNPQSGNVYVGVQALSVPSGYTGSYSFQLVASIDMPYTAYLDYPSLYFLDSDSAAGLFVSTNISSNAQEQSVWDSLGPRYQLFVQNQNNTQTVGLMRSYCALQNATQSGGPISNQTDVQVETGLNTIGGSNLKQQFYVSSLNRSSTYYAAMGLPTNFTGSGSGQKGGGGTVWQAVNFTTKSDGNCQVIYNLSFCDQVAYAVPSNPNNFARLNLSKWYDSNARNLTTNFNQSLDQIACDTTSDAQYSLAVNCTDCRQAYKNWLCAVTMPRCDDYSTQKSYTIARAISYPFLNGTMGNADSDPMFSPSNRSKLFLSSSRNPTIDQVIQPGPYKEVLPCGNLCYALVRSCPASLGFACPYDPKGYNQSYGFPLMDGPLPQCNMPGAVYGVSVGPSIRPLASLAIFTTLVSLSMVQFLPT